MNSSEAVEKIETRFQNNILLKNSFRDELSLTVTKDSLIEIMTFCKKDLGFDYLVDLTAVDNLGVNPRYEVVYELYSYSDSCSYDFLVLLSVLLSFLLFFLSLFFVLRNEK